MTVAMQAQCLHRAGALEALSYAVERHGGDARIRRGEIGWNEAVREQPVARFLAEALQVECGPVGEARARPHGVNAADEAPQPLADRSILELRGAAATVRVDGKTKAGEGDERAAAFECERLDGRNFFG